MSTKLPVKEKKCNEYVNYTVMDSIEPMEKKRNFHNKNHLNYDYFVSERFFFSQSRKGLHRQRPEPIHFFVLLFLRPLT